MRAAITTDTAGECALCLEDFAATAEMPSVALPCHHAFHAACFAYFREQWKRRGLGIADFGFLKKEIEALATKKPAKLLAARKKDWDGTLVMAAGNRHHFDPALWSAGEVRTPAGLVAHYHRRASLHLDVGAAGAFVLGSGVRPIVRFATAERDWQYQVGGDELQLVLQHTWQGLLGRPQDGLQPSGRGRNHFFSDRVSP